MQNKIISGDGHIDLKWLPHDLFVSGAPTQWKNRVPHVVETGEGKRWYAEGRDLMTLPFGGTADMSAPPLGLTKRLDRMHEHGFFDGKPYPSDPELRIQHQEMDGVDAEVIYGILGMYTLIQDPELLRLVYRTYNSWMADFCNSNPQRFAGLACLPNDDPEIAAGELRRAAGLGLKGADFCVSSAVKPIWHRDWDPLWAASDECAMPISFHATGFPVREPSDEEMAREYASPYLAVRLALLQIAGAEYLASIIFSGAPERYPGMKFVLGECGATWIPHALARMDEEYDDQFRHLNFSLKPSEYWQRNGFTTFQNEPLIGGLVHLVGDDNVVWGSDYPHNDGIWPDSLTVIEAQLGTLDEMARRKITCENARHLYRFPD